MKKILLTGANGFIGKNILESFLVQKYEIFAPSSSQLNLLNETSVDKYFDDKYFDVVLHAATKPSHRNAKDLSDICSSNVKMFENLLRQKHRYQKFINFGSGAIYDTSKDIVDAKEEDIFKNAAKDELGLCKYLIQKQILELDNFVDLNIFGIFGRYEDWEIRFISNAICKTICDMPITLRQNRKFSYLFIDDLMPILEFFIENGVDHKSYNVVPDDKYSLFELAELVKKISGKDVPIIVSRDGFGFEYSASNARLKNEFANLKFTNIEQSVSALYNYYRLGNVKFDKCLLFTDK